MADYVPKLGELVREGDQRDAIHIAVVPVKIWGKGLRPGMHVGVRELTGELWATKSGDPIGVLDPFYKQPFEANQKAWMLLYPGSVVGLRHQYRHPVLDAALIRQETIELLHAPARQCIEQAGEIVGMSYDRMMQAAGRYLDAGDSELVDMNTSNAAIDIDWPKFWAAYSLLTNRNPPEDDRRDFFTCSC